MFDLQESPRRILAGWIWEQLADIEMTSLFDPYGGDGRVSNYLKRQGRQVLVNDPLACHYWWNRALVENPNEALSLVRQDALQQPHADESRFTGFADWAGRYFSDEEVGWLGRWYLNIGSQGLSEGEQALAHVAVYWTIGYWLDHNQRYIQDKAMAPHEVFQTYMEQANAWVYDNGMPNAAYCGDPYDLAADMPTDALLLVAPPMAGWAEASLRTRLWEGWTQGNAQAPLAVPGDEAGPKLGQTFTERGQYRSAIDALLAQCEAMPYWILSYQEGAPFTRDEWVSIISLRRSGVFREATHDLTYPTAVGDSTVREGLLVMVAQ
ncbi:MAG: hypothetical protein H7338_07070 [Candidatus Sericytochromatia bacterium]|nr:hypothetical protein [Candidatus Sericytochromatia bacterium]